MILSKLLSSEEVVEPLVIKLILAHFREDLYGLLLFAVYICYLQYIAENHYFWFLLVLVNILYGQAFHWDPVFESHITDPGMASFRSFGENLVKSFSPLHFVEVRHSS